MRVCVLLLSLALLCPLALSQPPRVGEAEHDSGGKLLWSSDPSGVRPERSASPARSGLNDSHVKYRSEVERKAFFIWVWRRDRERFRYPSPYADRETLRELDRLQRDQQRLFDLLLQLQRRRGDEGGRIQIFITPFGERRWMPRAERDFGELDGLGLDGLNLPFLGGIGRDGPEGCPDGRCPREGLPEGLQGPRGQPYAVPREFDGAKKPPPSGYQSYSRQPARIHSTYPVKP